ncbi:acyl carrier protein [Candidatus Thioglobus sp.]|uniref:acyl carrier protein n=1 Tax=Candidatus Thioglobus sp. TaxID=2026721 RepID=UPI003D0DF6CA
MDITSRKLKGIIASIKKIPVSDVDLNFEDDFIQKYNLDSLDSVALTIEMGSIFGISFGEQIDDIDALSSFGSLVNLIESRVP